MGGASAVHGGAHPMGTTYSTRNYSQDSVFAFIFVVTVALQQCHKQTTVTQVQIHSQGHMSGASAVHGGAHSLGTTYSTRSHSQHPVYAFIFVVTVALQQCHQQTTVTHRYKFTHMVIWVEQVRCTGVLTTCAQRTARATTHNPPCMRLFSL